MGKDGLSPGKEPDVVLGIVREFVEAQSRDEALWAAAETPMEAYLQLALRALHGTVDGDSAGAIFAERYLQASSD